MIISNVYQAKAKLSSLINQALSGEKVFISKDGEPKVQLVPVESAQIKRTPGLWKGKVQIKKDFDKLPEKLIKLFSGE